MSPTKFSAGVVLALGLMTAPVCAEEAAAKPAATYTFIDSADPAVAELAQAGFKAIEVIGGRLIQETTRELATKETRQAVAVLHLKDLELPKPVAGKPTVTAVKRTSLMLRDLRNAPDAADTAALQKIQEQMSDTGQPDKMYVQKIEQPGLPVEWRVYRPIATTKACLACHGDPSKFNPGVKEELDRLYPLDRALDYSAQQWRGVIRVTLAPAAQK